MKKPPPPPRRRHLSKEDEALWEHTAAGLKPLKIRKPRHLEAMPDPDAVAPFEAKPKAAQHPPRVDKPAETPPKPARPAPPLPPLSIFERKAARRLRQGQLEIEARIDLHGMRQHEAHATLRRFLLGAAARGLRWVLVITGKGAPRARDDDAPVLGNVERGVLRRNVPVWLAEPELRTVVVSFTTAAIPHGGEGALYIQLRKPDRLR